MHYTLHKRPRRLTGVVRLITLPDTAIPHSWLSQWPRVLFHFAAFCLCTAFNYQPLGPTRRIANPHHSRGSGFEKAMTRYSKRICTGEGLLPGHDNLPQCGSTARESGVSSLLMTLCVPPSTISLATNLSKSLLKALKRQMRVRTTEDVEPFITEEDGHMYR